MTDPWQAQYAPDLIAAERVFRRELDEADERLDPHYFETHDNLPCAACQTPLDGDASACNHCERRDTGKDNPQ